MAANQSQSDADERRKAYEAANPLGGPARMFEAIASRIRAGEDYHEVLRDYDLQHISPASASTRDARDGVIELIYEIIGAPKDAPYGDLPGYVRDALKATASSESRERRLLREARAMLLSGSAHGQITRQELADRIDALLAQSETAISATAKGPLTLDNERQVFFYEQDHYYLSNFSAFNLDWHGETFSTSEHAYQFTKFSGEPEVQDLIRKARSAHDAFKLAEQHRALRRTDWDDIKVRVMRGIVSQKAAQHEYVRRKLLQTGDRELIENSWRDPYWGWGENRDGLNMLGKVWMEVRAEIRSDGDRTKDLQRK